MSILIVRSSISAAARSCLVARHTSRFPPLSEESSALNDDDLTDPPPPLPPNAYPPSNPFRTSQRLSKYAEGKPRYRLHVHSTRNNTITTFTQPGGDAIAWFSGGSCGFKKGNRASYEAGYQCAVRMFKRIEKEAEDVGSMELELFFKGFGQGREALQRALLTSEGEPVRPLVVTVTDRTPIKIGGTRAKKMRRLWYVSCTASLWKFVLITRDFWQSEAARIHLKSWSRIPHLFCVSPCIRVVKK